MAKTYRQFDPKKDGLHFDFSYNTKETRALHKKLNNNASIDIDDLRRISLWKLDRVLSVSDETLELLRRLAKAEIVKVGDELSTQAIEALVASEGIGYPMASAILKFVRPDVFPIIDVRAYRALTGKKAWTYNLEKYVDYTNELMKIAKQTGRSLADIDEQLYCFDDKHNDKI